MIEEKAERWVRELNEKFKLFESLEPMIIQKEFSELRSELLFVMIQDAKLLTNLFKRNNP